MNCSRLKSGLAQRAVAVRHANKDRMMKMCRMALAMALGWACLSAVPAQAGVELTFSDLSSDSTPASVLDATALFSVVGSQLKIDLNNTSDYLLAQLYFNTDTTLTGLAFNSAGATNAAWSVSGSGASQSQGADGMGAYNWLIDFGSGSNRLGSDMTSLVFDMTGTTMESTIGSKLSTIPPGSQTALAVLKFEAGPEGDSAFGGSRTSIRTEVVPEPGTLVLLATGCGPMLLGLRRRFRR